MMASLVDTMHYVTPGESKFVRTHSLTHKRLYKQGKVNTSQEQQLVIIIPFLQWRVLAGNICEDSPMLTIRKTELQTK